MIWILIFMNNMHEPKHTFVGRFPTYAECHKEAVYLGETSSYFKYWGCVQLTETDIAHLNKAKAGEKQ